MKEKAEVEAVVADFSRDCSQGVVVRREKVRLGLVYDDGDVCHLLQVSITARAATAYI